MSSTIDLALSRSETAVRLCLQGHLLRLTLLNCNSINGLVGIRRGVVNRHRF